VRNTRYGINDDLGCSMNPPRRRWSASVVARWKPRPGLFTSDSRTIANEVLEGHGWDLASSVASLNFYINRAGRNLSGRDRSRLGRAMEIIRHEGASASRKATRRRRNCRISSNPGDEEEIVLSGESRLGEYRHDEQMIGVSQRGCGCTGCRCRGRCACPCCCERVDVLCQCGWGRLAISVSDVPRQCPLCGVHIRENSDSD
jgi:hypothetical protein